MFKIRKFQDDDTEECRGLWRELTEWHRKIYQDPNIGGEHPEHQFDEHLSKVGSERLWVAAYDSKVVGLVGLVVEDEEAEIEPLIVSENYRGKGIGKKILEAVISETRKLHVKFLTVRPVARNTQAIKFLYKQGFVNLGHIDVILDLSNYKWKSGPELYECNFNF
jgi:GNAT superfamily N-acetyltransferase